MAAGGSRVRARAAAVVSLALILVLTLAPGDRPLELMRPPCLLCDYGSLADLLANALLFAPLGAALAALRRRWWTALAAGFALSLAVELVQWLALASRDGNPRDVLANGIGAVGGYALWRLGAAWRDPGPATDRRLGRAAVALAAVSVLATGWLSEPSLPLTRYFGQWTPQFPHQDEYGGRVLRAELGGRELPSRELREPAEIRRGLLGGDTLRIAVTAAPVPGVTTLFSIFDHDGRQIVTALGARGGDLEWYVRRRGTTARLIEPPLRVPDVLGTLAPGDTIALTAWRQGRSWCAGVAAAIRCAGVTAGDGWKLLVNWPLLWRWERPLGAAWLALLLLPAGYWVRGSRWAPAAALLVVGVAPLAGGLNATPPEQWFGAVLGVAAGWRLRRVLSARQPGDAGSSATSSAVQRSTLA